jgi:malonyl-CoA O-methyltransferase
VTRPPSIDPTASARWHQLARQQPSAWLHEEVARRMFERLQWIRLQPAAWLHWEPQMGGLAVDADLRQKYPQSKPFWQVAGVNRTQLAIKNIAKPWWQKLWPYIKPAAFAAASAPPLPPGQSVDMLWANMQLHLASDPAELIEHWHAALAVDGFLMFSCLGPDTCASLRALYADLGWGPSAHELTDMHDWGDMLVQAGFAQPVMDMERITLTFASPERLLQELRGLGRNLHRARFAGLRGRAWRARLLGVLREHLAQPDGQLALTFEVIYGHALKPEPRVRVSEHSAISLQDMRAMLGKKQGV